MFCAIYEAKMRLATIFLLLVGVSSPGQSFLTIVPSSVSFAEEIHVLPKILGVPQGQPSSVSGVLPIRTYPNSPNGLERLFEDMVTLEKQGDAAALNPYLQSLVLPDAESWFKSKFGDEHCEDEHLAANDCLGTRLALRYATTAKNLPAAAALTLSDLIDEHLTNFEAVNHNEPCGTPQRIHPASKLVADLTVTPILSDVLSGLVKQHEPVYVLWSYSEKEETTIGFFVYSNGAFRYIGMPHPVSVEELAQSKEAIQGNGEHVETSSTLPPADDLTNEIVAMKTVLIDPGLVQRTVVLHVIINEAGRASEVSYVRGPEESKDAAIQSVKQRQFERQSFAGRPVALATCINVVAAP